MGMERLLLALEKQNLLPEPTVEPSVFVVALGDAAKVEAFKICQALHDEYITVEMDGQGKSMKAQLKYANKINAKYVIILGDDELARGEAIIRFMDTSEQKTVSLNIVAEDIKTIINDEKFTQEYENILKRFPSIRISNVMTGKDDN